MLSGDIRLGNSYYEDLHECVGKFDFVMANPPFNVDKVDKEKRSKTILASCWDAQGRQRQLPLVSLFYSALNAKGRAGFVMANSAADARQSKWKLERSCCWPMPSM
ncbi:MAG: N-6 DNA methylase [Planctomycetaceae bacterium]